MESMKVIDRFNVSKGSEGPKKYTFEFTGHGLVSLLVLAVFGIAWIFFLGVLLGRGNKPENAVPQLAKIMPTPSADQQNAQPTVLKPEELQFQDTLQGRTPPETVTVDSTQKTGGAQAPPNAAPQTSPQTPVSKQPVAQRVAAQEKPAAPLPKGRVATAKAEPDKKAPRPEPEKKSVAPPSKKPVEIRVYQVAALDKETLARAEAEKLKKKGLAAMVEKSGAGGKSVYRVVVRVKGTEAEIKQALEKSGTKKPILRDKKSL